MVEKSSFRSGFVAIIGRPNVGKSTLLNAYLGQKVAAVSPRPQTTRRKQLGILTTSMAQIIWIDTPGIHHPDHQLGDFMNREALSTLGDADLILWLVEANVKPTPEDSLVASYLSAVKPSPKVLLALNKTDQVSDALLAERQAAYQALYPDAEVIVLSALTGLHRDVLLQRIIELLPEGPQYYDEEQITDLYEREISADLIREAVLSHLQAEVPHCVAVEIDEFTERGDSGAYLVATLHVERESQKGIVIGKGAAMIKRIGATARKAIEDMSGRKVYLELRVQVSKNWRNDPKALQRFGYHRREGE